MRQFGASGLAPFLPAWDALDGLRGREVVVRTGDRAIVGTELGVAPSGALRLMTAEGERHYLSGEVSLRAAPTEPAS
jgi:biotin-(acetyl-CoA carboxylase) ligase